MKAPLIHIRNSNKRDKLQKYPEMGIFPKTRLFWKCSTFSIPILCRTRKQKQYSYQRRKRMPIKIWPLHITGGRGGGLILKPPYLMWRKKSNNFLGYSLQLWENWPQTQDFYTSKVLTEKNNACFDFETYSLGLQGGLTTNEVPKWPGCSDLKLK